MSSDVSKNTAEETEIQDAESPQDRARSRPALNFFFHAWSSDLIKDTVGILG
jgi:hypothetical protein